MHLTAETKDRDANVLIAKLGEGFCDVSLLRPSVVWKRRVYKKSKKQGALGLICETKKEEPLPDRWL